MKVREDLVYDKTGEILHGFVNLGDVNNQIQQLEQQADSSKLHNCFATQMLTLMVRGIFIKLEFPYANFPTQGIFIDNVCFTIHIQCVTYFSSCNNDHAYMYNTGVTGELLYWIMWEAVRRLEEINLKVNNVATVPANTYI